MVRNLEDISSNELNTFILLFTHIYVKSSVVFKYIMLHQLCDYLSQNLYVMSSVHIKLILTVFKLPIATTTKTDWLLVVVVT